MEQPATNNQQVEVEVSKCVLVDLVSGKRVCTVSW